MSWQESAGAQAGLLSRAQALACSLSRSAVDHWLVTGRWVRALPGVYRTYTGEPTPLAGAWAAVLYAGAGVSLDAGPSLWLAGVAQQPPQQWPVLVPVHRRVVTQPGSPITVSRHLDRWVHPSLAPPRLRVEAAVLRATELCSTVEQVVDVVVLATSSCRTTAARSAAEVRAWPRLRWRALPHDLVTEVEDGVASPLERRWRADVEIAHALPRGRRNVAVVIAGRRRYRDVRYEPFGVVVELDGRSAHPAGAAFRDRERDNAAARSLELALRYGWREVSGDPCRCADELAALLRLRGWRGQPRRCGRGCGAATSASA